MLPLVKNAAVFSMAGAVEEKSFSASVMTLRTVSLMTLRTVSFKRLFCCALGIKSTTYSPRRLLDCAEKRTKASRWRRFSMSNVRYRLSRIPSSQQELVVLSVGETIKNHYRVDLPRMKPMTQQLTHWID